MTAAVSAAPVAGARTGSIAGSRASAGAAPFAHGLVAQEARALLTRLDRVRPFALTETMVPAATVSVPAQAAVERYLIRGRHALRAQVLEFLRWLASAAGRSATPEAAHRRFTFLRIRFNVVLSHLDVFSEVMTQRSEHETGVLLAGLDAVATDALALPGAPYEMPPLMCYLQRGQGAAIRRARTRLPGGGETPVAIIKIPRERMVGSGIASSLVHEVGHQGAALLDLVPSLRAALQRRAAAGAADAATWRLWERWISEIVADLWSVARVGVASTLGLMGVVALPRVFVFRRTVDAPHPIPWIRVKLSCAMGRALYPHSQWDRIAAVWESFYPTTELDPPLRELLARLERHMPEFVRLVVEHRPPALRGRTLRDALASADRQPARLAALYRGWGGETRQMRSAPPTLVFAVIGQAKLDGRISPEEEGRTLTSLLTYWALRSALDASEICASVPRRPVLAPAS